MTDERLSEIRQYRDHVLACVVLDQDVLTELLDEAARLREVNRRLLVEVPRCGCTAAVDSLMRQLGS